MAPTTAPAPIVTPGSTVTPRPSHALRPILSAPHLRPSNAPIPGCEPMIGVADTRVLANHYARADFDPRK